MPNEIPFVGLLPRHIKTAIYSLTVKIFLNFDFSLEAEIVFLSSGSAFLSRMRRQRTAHVACLSVCVSVCQFHLTS